MCFFPTIKQTQFPCAFSSSCPSRFSLFFFIHFTVCLDFQPGPLLALDIWVSAFLLSCGNSPSPTPEQRRANHVPTATAFHLLHPLEGQVFDSSTLRFPLPSDALTLSPSWRSRETDRRFPDYFAGTRHGQVWYYTPILCFSPGLASGRFLERDLLGCLLKVWENIWNSYSEMFYFSISLEFVILVL